MSEQTEQANDTDIVVKESTHVDRSCQSRETIKDIQRVTNSPIDIINEIMPLNTLKKACEEVLNNIREDRDEAMEIVDYLKEQMVNSTDVDKIRLQPPENGIYNMLGRVVESDKLLLSLIKTMTDGHSKSQGKVKQTINAKNVLVASRGDRRSLLKDIESADALNEIVSADDECLVVQADSMTDKEHGDKSDE